jgi:hypothetical protein
VDGLTGLFLPKISAGKAAENVLSRPDLAAVSGEMQHNIQNLKDAEGGGKVILIIDQLDLFLAAGGDQITAVSIEEMLISLREVRIMLKIQMVREVEKHSGGAFNNLVPLSGLSSCISKSDTSGKGPRSFGAQPST